MSFYATFRTLERLADLIRRERTGSAAELAARLEVCPRTVKNLLNQLRNLGGGGRNSL